jgi:hypothetical protein
MNYPNEQKMQESVSLTLTRYRDGFGKPTCAVDFTKDGICQFYRTSNFGTVETCAFAEPGQRQRRRGSDGSGYLIPGPYCILFTAPELKE